MRFRRASAIAGLVALSSWAVLASGQETYVGRLSTVPIDTRTQAEITGMGAARASLDGNRLTIDGRFEGLQGPAISAHLHLGAATGVRGPAIDDLTATHDVEGTITGTVRLNNREIAALRAGRLYVQLESEAAPEGNLWGWLLP